MDNKIQNNELEQGACPPEKIKHYLDDYFETFDMATYHIDALACPCPYDHGGKMDIN